MRRIVYISTGMAIDERDLGEILAVAQRENARHEITGFLMFNGRNFIQLIEGETEALNALMAKLTADPRHSGLVTLIDEAIDQRCCANWSMNRINLLDGANQRRNDIDEALPALLDGVARRVVLNYAALN